jgi:hypothetical protein
MSEDRKKRWPYYGTMAASVTLGTCYGLIFRFSDRIHFFGTSPRETMLMTLAFLVAGPFAIGYITIHFASQQGVRPWWQWVLAPWLPVLLVGLVTFLFRVEGLICIVFAMPLALLLASAGGVAAGLVGRRKTRAVLSVACLPILLAPVESRLPSPEAHRMVENQIAIHAAPATVWRNIERVPAIDARELKATWAHAIGFPRPVEATLSHEGVGGVRHASFERGLLFIETVNEWEPERRLGFSIHADTAHIPLTTLDEHVTVGGRYFDVLRGEYRIEPVEGGGVILHLESEQRLSTDFNGYAGLWTEAVMSSLQESILEVIRKRCEEGR